MSALWDRLPLPAEHAVAMLAGVLLQSRTPRTRLPSGVEPAGWPLLATGLALNVWAVRARGAGHLERPQQLVTAGPYAHTRNPMYVGWGMLHLGLALAMRSPWVLAVWPVSRALVHRTVLHEERQLAARFGDELTEYAARVPRYLVRHSLTARLTRHGNVTTRMTSR